MNLTESIAPKSDQWNADDLICIATDTWPGDDDEPGDAEPIMPRPYYLESMDEEEMVIS